MGLELPERGRCPRDGGVLVAAAGSLGEDVCARCQGRVLDGGSTVHLLCDILGIERGILQELAREGARRLVCPACGVRMTSTWARSVQVELCSGCGSCFLDGGELQRLTQGAIEEVHVSSAAMGTPGSGLGMDQVAGATPRAASSGQRLSASTIRGLPAHKLRFGLKCVSCDAPLDLTRSIWMVNTRPWCDPCAWPHTSMWASFVSLVVGVLKRLASPRHGLGLSWWTESDTAGPDLWERAPDAMRVSPAEFDRFFGSFYVVIRDDD